MCGSPLSRFCIKPGYQARAEALYFDDEPDGSIVHQPDLYPFARHVARRYGCDTVLDLGCGSGLKLIELADEFRIVGVDIGANIEFCRARHSMGDWREIDLERGDPLGLSPQELRRTLIVVGDVIEHLVDPMPLLSRLRRLLDDAPAVVLTTPDRDRARGLDDTGPPANPHHIREWNAPELRRLLTLCGFRISAFGWTRNNDRDGAKNTLAAVCHGPSNVAGACRPSFRVQALVATYNEADIIVPSLRHLRDQGVEVHVLDNWSTDDTRARIGEAFGEAVTVEMCPAEGPTATFEWARILQRKEELAREIDADWFMHCDPDEIRRSPWPDLDLRSAFWRVSEEGFSAIDFTVVNFRPTDESFMGGDDFEEQFARFEWGTSEGHRSQIKAWKKCEDPQLVESGGHDTRFLRRRVYPLNFLNQHYPIRSTSQGRRKILNLRERIDPDEGGRRGWHHQYDGLALEERLVWDAEDLVRYDPDSFQAEYLFECLARIGPAFDGVNGVDGVERV